MTAGAESNIHHTRDDGASPRDGYDVRSIDPHGELLDRAKNSEGDLAQIAEIMADLGALRDAERRLLEASRAYMQLGLTDMRALQFLISREGEGRVATPGAIAQHLGISTAATTKLLDRLAREGHITRAPHPTDRRALAITVAPAAREAAMRSMGRAQVSRIRAAADLSSSERATVRRFVQAMTAGLTNAVDGWPSDGTPRPALTKKTSHD